MKCGSDGCERPAAARWEVARSSNFLATPTAVQVTFVLCAEHDEWYQTLSGYACVRIGLLVDEGRAA